MKMLKSIYITAFLFLLCQLVSAQEKLVTNETINTYVGSSYRVVESLTIEPPSGGGQFRVSASEHGNFHIKIYDREENNHGSTDKNFIRTEVAQTPYTNEYYFGRASRADKATTFEYFDGLGRAIQTVNVQNSPNLKDQIQPVVYDDFGREHLKYMPYIESSTDGRYHGNADTQASTFYDNLKGDDRPFTEILFDDSPLNRPIGQFDPGLVWKTQGKKKESNIIINAASEIRRWEIESGEAVSYGHYPANSLIGSKSIDEDGRQKVEYKDSREQTIVKRTLGDTGWFDTYYVYDELGNLRFVLPPEALNESSNPATSIDNFTYAYVYDEKKRVIQKKLPGKDWEYFIYDKWDRLVLSQDGNMRHQVGREALPDIWKFYKYDEFNRIIMEGFTEEPDKPGYIVGTEYGNGYSRYEVTTNNATGYTTDQSFPDEIYESEIRKITYYDNYDFKSNTGWDAEGHSYNYVNEPEISNTVNTAVKGQETGSKIRVEAGMWLNTVNYYDDKYQNIQSITENHLDGTDRISNEYDFTGKVLKTKRVHTSSLDGFTSLETFEYDHAGRLLKTYHSMDGADNVLIAENSYNEIGELIERNHYAPNGQKLQSVDFKYNIRGWLTGINNTELDDGENDLFGMDLYYNNAPSVNGQTPEARYNGNIAAMSWKTDNKEGSPKASIYGYGYDMLERLKTASYAEKSGSNWNIASNQYDVAISDYDKNGNILGLERWAANAGNKTKIDELEYRYNGNQLINVKDYSNNNYGFKDLVGSPTSLTEYEYDYNGNMIYDLNKGIEEVSYTNLNLPRTVYLEGDHSMSYVYDATGAKLSTSALENGYAIRKTDYVAGAQYENDELDFVSMSHGRIVNNDGTWEYEYFLNDHLGNTRLTYGFQKEVNKYLATMETEKSTQEDAEFTQLDPKTDPGAQMNHTKGSLEFQQPDESLLLRAAEGAMNNAMGAGKYLRVNGGDKVTAEVYAHYEASTGDPSDIIPGIVSAVSGTFGSVGGAEGSAIEGALNDELPGVVSGISSGSAPKAYLIYMLFTSDFSTMQFGYDNVETTAASGWEKLEFSSTIFVPGTYGDGHLFIYVANESDIETYFDDMKIVHEINGADGLRVTQSQDYYPYGLTYNAYQKPTASTNQYKFQGQEHQADFDLGWSQFKWRNSDPAIGRFFNIDPIAEDYYYNSTYAFSENKVVNAVELEGLEKLDFMTHWTINGAAAPFSYSVDWLSDKIIGGGVRAGENAIKYAQNEYYHSKSQRSRPSELPVEVSEQIYQNNRVEYGTEVAKGMLDQFEGYTTLQGFAMGGVEGTYGSLGLKTLSQRVIIKNVPKNGNNSYLHQLYKKALSYEAKSSPFNLNGTLKDDVLKNSETIIRGTEFGNKELVNILTKDGSNIANWSKMRYSIRAGEQHYQIHYYYNQSLNKAFYELDYKTILNNNYFKVTPPANQVGNWGY